MRRFGLIFFVALSLIWVTCIRTDGFSPAAIEGTLFREPVVPVAPEIEAILSQPFCYLSKGRQCFVFESADGKYVIKFFNQKYLKEPWYTFLVKKEKSKRALRRFFYENSYEIAYRELGEEILYLHLGPADRPLPPLSLTDRASRQFVLDLNSIPFVLQRKGTPFYPSLDAIYQKKGIEGLCREIDSFVRAVGARIEKKIADGDRDVEHNWGYVDGKIFHLDPGRLYYDEGLTEPERLNEEWNAATQSFHKWLKGHYPEAATYLEKKKI